MTDIKVPGVGPRAARAGSKPPAFTPAGSSHTEIRGNAALKVPTPGSSPAAFGKNSRGSREIASSLRTSGFEKDREKGIDLDDEEEEHTSTIRRGRPRIENYEERLASKEVQSDDKQMKDLLLFFPEHDIEVVTVPRVFRTETSVVKARVHEKGLGPVKDALHVFTQDWTVVKRKYEQFDGKTKPPSKGPNVDMPQGDSPQEEVKGTCLLDQELLQPPSLEARRKETTDRSSNRIELFNTYTIPRNERSEPTDTRQAIEFFPQPRITQLLMQAKELTWALGAIEPFFGALFLYDIVKKQRISETFYFELNPENLTKMISARLEPGENVDPIMSSPFALFKIRKPSTSTYLVLRIEKILTGDADSQVDDYMKHASLKPKERSKLVKDTETQMVRLARYTMPFAWSAMHLFQEDGKLTASGEVTFRDLVRIKSDHTDDKLADLIRRKEKESKKEGPRGSIPGYFKLGIGLVNPDKSELPGRIDSNLMPVLPLTRESKFLREMEEFMKPGDGVAIPSANYINHMYVYLDEANLSKLKGRGSSRNIAVRVQLRESDTQPEAQGLPAIYGRSGGGQFRTYAHTTCLYHTKKPTYYDEFKIELPAKLTSHHHLFFTFLHVTVKPGKKDIETVVGYAFQPIFKDGRIIKDDLHKIPLASSLPTCYTSEIAEETAHWVDNMKPLFSFSTRLVSTVYTQSDDLNFFLNHFASEKDDSELCQAIDNLAKVEGELLVQHFPLLMNELFHVLTNRSLPAATSAFNILPHILKSVDQLTLVSGKKQRNPYLVSYVDGLLDCKKDSKSPLYQLLVRFFLKALKSAHPQLPEIARFGWFFFDAIIKSMVLHLNQQNQLGNTDKRAKRFPGEFYEELRELVDGLMVWIRDFTRGVQEGAVRAGCPPIALNADVAIFLKDLLSLADRTVIFEIIDNYIGKICPSNTSIVLAQHKFDMLKILCDHEHFIPLNLPIKQTINDVPVVVLEFWQAHFLVGTLLHEVCGCLTVDKPIRFEAISVLRNVLWKHDIDSRYKDPAVRMRIASIYFPFVLQVLEHVSTIENMENDEKGDWLICFLWIVSNQDSKQLVRKWWKKDTVKSVSGFFKLLKETVKLFSKSAQLGKEVGFRVLSVVEDFMADFPTLLCDEKSDHMGILYPVIAQLWQIDHSVSFLLSLSASMRYYIFTFRKVLFKWKNTSFCGDLAYEILRHCNFPHVAVMSKAASLFYLLIKTNFSETRTFSRVRLQSTIAVSKLTSVMKDYKGLETALNATVKYAQRDSPGAVHKAVEELCSRLMGVIKDSLKMAAFQYDPEMTADLVYTLSKSYADSPDLRVTWLENLCRFHVEQQKYSEAVQCKILVAALISEFLMKQQKGAVDCFPPSYAAFLAVSPNIQKEPPLPDIPLHLGEEEGMYNPNTFSEEGLARILREAIDLAKKASLFEQIIDIYKYLTAMGQKDRNYKTLAFCFSDMKRVCEDLVQSNARLARLFGNCYRVAFYGPAWGDQAGKEYIYRETETTRLPDVSNRLKAQFCKEFGAQKVEILSNATVDVATLKKDVYYFQVVSVTEYFHPAELKERVDLWERKFNVDRFIFETPFTKGGKAHSADMREQYKKKTILYTERPFPFVLSRIPVKKKEEIVLEPIEAAVELIQGRVDAIRKEVESKPHNPKTLQQVLQGSVLVTVNAGPLEVARIFLSEESKYNPAHVQALKENMHKFVSLCQLAVWINKSLITPEQEEFQAHLESGLQTTMKELHAFIPSIKERK